MKNPMLKPLILTLGLLLALGNSAAANTWPFLWQSQPDILVKVSLQDKQMTVWQKGRILYRWPVSTARRGKITPKGEWTAKWLSKNHKSSRYNNAPMPYSIFFNGHYAIHGTDQLSRLGRPASAGCIRLHPENAAILFSMTREVGLDHTLIRVVD